MGSISAISALDFSNAWTSPLRVFGDGALVCPDYLLAKIYESEPGFTDSDKHSQYLKRSVSRGYQPEG